MKGLTYPMWASTGTTLLHSARVGALFLFCAFLMGAPSASARPIADGSKCRSDWVNNENAMACFIQGEEETRKGAKHPHYVACYTNGVITCCVDDDRGNQNCEAVDVVSSGQQSIEDMHVRAILDAQQTIFTVLDRISRRLDKLERKLGEPKP